MQARDELGVFGVEVSSHIWRIAHKKYKPMVAPPGIVQGKGRFDCPTEEDDEDHADYGVLYCGETEKSAFLESISFLRDRIDIVAELLSQTVLEVDERDSHSNLNNGSGVVPQDWMNRNQLASASLTTLQPVFDLANPAAVHTLRSWLAPTLIALGLDDLDFSHVLSDNRSLTQAISRWLWTMTTDSHQPLFSGIRYRSRFDPECICIALYEDRYEVDGEIDIQRITPETPGFAEAASTLRLTIA